MSDMTIRIDELVTSKEKVTEPLAEEPTMAEDAEQELELQEPAQDSCISVDFTEIEPISIKSIVDVHGRLSDILESVEDDLGISVIPLKMVDIAPEVEQLQRHEIFTLGGVRYAFSHRVRKNVCDHYLEQIVTCLSEGVPFTLELATTIIWQDKQYNTFLLSRDEWTYIMSKCREFKQKLTTDNKSQITLHVYAEKVQG